MDLPYNPTILILGIYSKVPKHYFEKTFTLLCSAFFVVAKIGNHLSVQDTQVGKETVTYMCLEYYLTVKKVIIVCCYMDGTGGCQAE